jgi:hypothetical protein
MVDQDDADTERRSLDARDTVMTLPPVPSRRLRWVLVSAAGLAVLLGIALVLCSPGMPEPPPLPDPIDPPARTAVQDQAVRRLMTTVGRSRLCERLQGTLMPLPGRDAPPGRDGGLAPAIGRFWIERCLAEERDSNISLHLQGRGWTWADETRSGPMDMRFTVRGILRFMLQVDIEGSLDLGYSESTNVASVWLTPTRPPAARLNLQGEVPVQAESGLGGLFDILGQVLSSPVETRARPVIEQFGANEIARRLSSGLTTTVELCTGQLDVHQGALGDGETPLRPYTPDGTAWLDNQRAEVRGGSIDAAGPWDTGGRPLRVDIDVEQGGGVTALVLCQDQARLVIEAFLAQRPAPFVTPLAQQVVTPGAAATVRTRDLSCPAALVVTPSDQGREPTRTRYRVVAGDGRQEPLATCGH